MSGPPGLMQRILSGRRLPKGFMPSFTRLDLIGLPRYARLPVGRHLAAVELPRLLGHRPIRESPEALDRVGKLYDVERDISGQPADSPLRGSSKFKLPKVEAFFTWSSNSSWASRERAIGQAFPRYGLNRREAFSLFLEDGRVAIDKIQLNAPCDDGIRKKGKLAFAGADHRCRNTRPRHDDH